MAIFQKPKNHKPMVRIFSKVKIFLLKKIVFPLLQIIAKHKQTKLIERKLSDEEKTTIINQKFKEFATEFSALMIACNDVIEKYNIEKPQETISILFYDGSVTAVFGKEFFLPEKSDIEKLFNLLGLKF